MTVRTYLESLTGLDFPLTGNTGKVRALIELARLIEAKPGLSLLDIGCIGPNPLDFWRPLFTLFGGQFQLTGIDPDTAGIEHTRARLSEITDQSVTLLPGSGYDLTRLFPDQQFDVVVFTQVLEHVFHYRDFLDQVRQTVRPGGDVLFTLDSGHYPHRRWKDSIKGILARMGQERHYEHGWRDDELDPVLAQLGLDIVSREFYCTASGKRLHNKHVDPAQKNALMRLWFETEYYYNQHIQFDEAAKRQFLILFYHARRID
jgi:SAM-dependent methyltransferase